MYRRTSLTEGVSLVLYRDRRTDLRAHSSRAFPAPWVLCLVHGPSRRTQPYPYSGRVFLVDVGEKHSYDGLFLRSPPLSFFFPKILCAPSSLWEDGVSGSPFSSLGQWTRTDGGSRTRLNYTLLTGVWEGLVIKYREVPTVNNVVNSTRVFRKTKSA